MALHLTVRGLAEDNAQLWHDSQDELKKMQHEELEAIQHKLENIRLGPRDAIGFAQGFGPAA